tara:strand:- start:15 stop:581 length:567 start_codon:yes stop_codon:yes gene_type:complete
MTKAREWSDEEKQWMTDKLSYVPETGDLVWKEGASIFNNRVRAVGSVAGTINYHGYLIIGRWLEGKVNQYRLHRIVWFLNYGEVPSILDHINGNKLDNRVENLRPTTTALNLRNQKPRKNSHSKYKGVYYDKKNDSYRTAIRINHKYIHIGRIKFEKEAAEMYDKWVEENLTPLEREYAKTNKELGLL